MPSALETLVKILKLEKQQGCKNNAVIGGLSAFSEKWSSDAHDQARIPKHHKLVDELVDLMKDYDQVENRTDRLQTVNYMMDRITGRVPPPPEYQVTEEETPAPQQRDESPPDPPSDQHTDQDQSEAEKPSKQRRKSRHERQREQEARESEQAEPDENQTSVAEALPGAPEVDEPVPAPESAVDDGGIDGDVDDTEDTNTGIYEQVYVEALGYDDDLDSPEPYRSRSSRSRRSQMDIPPMPKLARAPRRPRPELDPAEAADALRGLQADVTNVKGVGPRMAQSLAKLGISTIDDLLFFLPRRYDDYTRLTYISKLPANVTATVVGTVRLAEVRVGRNNRKDFYMEIDDGSGIMSVRFFGQYFLSRQIRAGKQLVVSGKTSIFRHQLQMANPEWEELDTDNLNTIGIVPVYPLTEGLRARALRRLMKKTVDYWADRVPDYVPEPVLERAELADIGWAIKNLHFPEGFDHLEHARNRYVFDQLLTLQLAILANRRNWQSEPAQSLEVTDDFLEPFIDEVFPYPLTGAQRRAIDDIRRDIVKEVPMNRLLQGDVGSGKTAVAVTALAMTFANGKQGALMAPTSILAEQHYRGITATLEKMPGERKPVVGLLTSALTSTERESIYNGLRDGSLDIVIGTHALIQDNVEFHDLGLAIIDEQHRFGVAQRGSLRGKGTNPHLLVMTATPIPRTLALTLYADLDLSIMDEMPPGRKPVQTRIVEPVQRERIYRFIESQIKEGRQAFIVYPLVEASDTVAAESATEAYEHLSKVFFRYKVRLLHGRMNPVEKDEVMAAFANHEFDVMVTTSVAEVGVDIPNASVIVIEGANRFGLAQLHQFRGRVGRGQHESYCLLIPDTFTPEAEERLRAMESTTDGFKLAEIDWKLRGPGDLVGTRQSGQSLLKMAEHITPQLVELAQREARTIYEEDADLEHPEHHLLRERVVMLHSEHSDVS